MTVPWSNDTSAPRAVDPAVLVHAATAADDDRAQALDDMVARSPLSGIEDQTGVVPYAVPGTDDIVELTEESFGPLHSGGGYIEGLRRRDRARKEFEAFLETDAGRDWQNQQAARATAAEFNDGPIGMVWPEMWAADALAAKGLVQLGARGAANGLRWASRGSWFGPRAAEKMINVGGRMVPASKAGYVEFGPMSVPGSRVVKHMWGAPDAGSRTMRATVAHHQRMAGKKALNTLGISEAQGLRAAEEAASREVPTALDEYQRWARKTFEADELARAAASQGYQPMHRGDFLDHILGEDAARGTVAIPSDPDLAARGAALAKDLPHAREGMEKAVQVLRTQQANIDKAAEVLDKAAPEIAEQSKKAMAQIEAATAELKALNDTPWWKAVRLNQNSHIWRFGEAKKTADPLLSPGTGGGLNYLNFFTGRGVPPRAVSGLMRGIGRELLPFEFDTASRLGAVMHWLTSPNAVSAAMTFVAGKRVARWAGEKLGWISPASESELVQENNARAAVPAHDVPMTAPAPAGSAPQAAPTTDQVVDRVSVDFIRRKYASMAGYDRAAAAAERDRLLASLPDEVRQSAVDDVRERVFKMHHPGASYRALRAGGDKNKAVLDRFDADVFGTRSENDWLTEDLNAYQRGLNMHRYGGGF